MEIFRKIKGYQYYEVSNLGRVRSLDHWTERKNGGYQFYRGRVLRQSKSGPDRGYRCVMLTENGVQKRYSVHRLVAEAFIPNPDNFPCVNHKNEVKNDNRVENLEWCDVKYNNSYGTKPQRLSESRKGKPGHPHTQESKDKISARLSGKPFSEEHLKNIRIAASKRVITEDMRERARLQAVRNIGRKNTEETKRKMSEARRRYWEKRKSINN